MWEISTVKRKGKQAFLSNYWKCVLIALIIGLSTGGVSGGINAFNTIRRLQETGFDNYDYNYNYDYNEYDDDYYDYDDYYDTPSDTWRNVANFIFSPIFIIFGIIIFGLALVIGLAFTALVIDILEIGGARFFTQNARGNSELKDIVYGFTNGKYFNQVRTMFIRDIKIFLWTLLFIIPGIIKHYEYAMIPYILADNPDISTSEAFKQSKEMMNGNKLQYFGLELSFIGWALLSFLLCTIPMLFWTSPYMLASRAEVYLALKGEQGAYTGDTRTGYNPNQNYGQTQGYNPNQNYGQTQGYNPNQNYGQTQGYNPNQNYGQTQGYNPNQNYGQTQGYNPNQNYGQTQGYNPNQNYGQPQGYNPNQNYGQTQGYNPNQNYPTPPGSIQPADHMGNSFDSMSTSGNIGNSFDSMSTSENIGNSFDSMSTSENIGNSFDSMNTNTTTETVENASNNMGISEEAYYEDDKSDNLGEL